MPAQAERYTAVAIVLHWAIAAAILFNLALGWWMHQAIDAPDSQARAVAAFQLHKSLGLSVLLLSVIRLLWRLLHPPPPAPVGTPAWQRLAAGATHWLFYGLMIGLPLTGWLYVSTQWRGDTPLAVPTLWFGLFEVPHLFGLNEAARELRAQWAGQLVWAHWLLAQATIALLVLHVAAALKHRLINHDEVLARMLPVKAAGSANAMAPGRRWVLRLGFASIALTLVALLGSLLLPPNGTSGWALKARQDSNQTGISSANPDWRILPQASHIRFSGSHAGSAFNGRFTRWQVNPEIDSDDPTQSSITAVIHTGSATDGIPLHDKTLHETEWFDVAAHPTANYRNTAIRQTADGAYDMEGVLQIKNQDIPVSGLKLELSGNKLQISGRFNISRKQANLGMESDPAGQWVSSEIGVQVQAQFERPP